MSATGDVSAAGATGAAHGRGAADGRVVVIGHGPVATVMLDRPAKLNALTMAMLDDLEQVLARIDADPAVRVVVLASAGDRVFCAGADIKHFMRLGATDMWRTWTRRGHQVFDRLAALRQPTIAAVDGNAYGGGLELALACDLRVVADDATVGLTEVGLGTVPGWGGTWRLRELVGPARAKELILTGRPVDAARCASWGIATSLAPRASVLAAAGELAEEIASRSPVAVQMAKQAVDAGSAGAAMALEGLAGAASGGTADFTEGVSAFTERRDPTFTGS
ncbi:enoyl-CoA hydratase-related protein [Georgenia sp. M64]|uniref:enoyl-CoA hydratase/isomerase family protein n=1 Tax=Georgenia sp. M64 TaxID=3120520 RepID=UPI0030E3E590